MPEYASFVWRNGFDAHTIRMKLVVKGGGWPTDIGGTIPRMTNGENRTTQAMQNQGPTSTQHPFAKGTRRGG